MVTLKPTSQSLTKILVVRQAHLTIEIPYAQAWRTLAYKEVRLRISPLAKLGCFKSIADNFLVYNVTISLASGPI
jgi:hypothetical protein